jgi:CHASE2 domain-containing sensor protein
MNIVRSWRVTVQRVARFIAPTQQPEEKWNWKEFRHKVVEALPYILIIIMLVSWMEAAGWFRGFETFHLDTMIRAHTLRMSQNIVVVEISEDDYQQVFKGTSPLDKFKLLNLIQAIQKYNPSVIGVDIDTNDWGAPCTRKEVDSTCAQKCAELKTMLDDLRAAEKAPPGTKKQRAAIVWAAVPRSLEPPLELSPALGHWPLESDRQGIPRFPIDEDGSVRHFERRVEVAKAGHSCPDGTDTLGEKCYVPTFAQAILEEYTGASKADSDEHIIFNFHGDRYQFQSIDSRQFLPETVEHDTRTNAEIQNANKEIDESRAALLEGKVVLIGGGFPEARDEYFTPVGPMEGVRLNALAIQTDLSKGGITDFNEIGEWLIDVFVSIVLVGVFYRYENRPLTALWISAVAIPAAFVFSLLLFNTAAYWFNFIPVAAGVIIHQLSDMAEGRGRLQRELDKLRSEPERVEVDTASIEEIAVSENAEAGGNDEMSAAEDLKVKRAAGGAN